MSEILKIDDVICLNVQKIKNVLPLKFGMIGKAITVIVSANDYPTLLSTYRYILLMYRNYDLSYNQLMFLYDIYIEQYYKVL